MNVYKVDDYKRAWIYNRDLNRWALMYARWSSDDAKLCKELTEQEAFLEIL